MSKSENSIKAVLIGNAGTGKTSLVNRICFKNFQNSQKTTIGVDLAILKTCINSQNIKIYIWDTAGTEKFSSTPANLYQGVDAFLIVYSINDTESFKKIRYWIQQVQERCQTGYEMILIGNKCDLKERTVPYQFGKSLADEYHMPFFETSALKGEKVEEAVVNLGKMCLKIKSNENAIKINNNNFQALNEDKKKGCC